MATGEPLRKWARAALPLLLALLALGSGERARAEAPKATPRPVASSAGTKPAEASQHPSGSATASHPSAPAASESAPGPDPSPAGPSSSAAAAAARHATGASHAVAAGATSELAARFRGLAQNVRDLLAGKLDASVEPRDLFDIDLDDEHAVEVETARLQRLLAEPPAPATSASPGRKGAPARTTDAGADASAEPGDAGATDAGSTGLERLDEHELAARLDLDRARLAFYELPRDRRGKLLTQHDAERAGSTSAKAAQELSEAAKKADEAEAERQRALEAARAARTEALRLLAEERARVLSVAQQQAVFEQQLLRENAALDSRGETSLGWRRRVREAIAGAQSGDVTPDNIDTIYGDLRRELRAARDRLDTAIHEFGAESHVPTPGPSRLEGVSVDLDQSELQADRARVEREAARLKAAEHDQRARALHANFEETLELNRDRLSLYPFLSSDRRDRIVGFGPDGFEQARAELRQVSLVLQVHWVNTRNFLASIRKREGIKGENALTATGIALRLAIPIALFVWWRRRGDAMLEAWRENARERRRRTREVRPGALELALGFGSHVERPLAWLVLLAGMVGSLPESMRDVLEIQLPLVVFGWIFGGALVITSVDALAEGSDVRGGFRRTRTAELRLRSLRLVGYAIVGVALILSLSDLIVGKGTLYAWVLSTCWFGAIPITLALVRWWRPIVFERLAARRRRSGAVAWLLERQRGWRSFFTALAGGVFLLASGTARTVRSWASDFDVTRRALAYLFRRDMSRRAEAGQTACGPLEPTLFERLGPAIASRELVESVADDDVVRLLERLAKTGAGVFAVVGERGSGKTTSLRRLKADRLAATLLDCPVGGDLQALAAAVATAAGVSGSTSLEATANALCRERPSLTLLIDDAHRLVLPQMGGLQRFDEVLAVARRHSTSSAWVFAFDGVIWRFLERARGARPLFDEVLHLEPWREEGIGRLLEGRSAEVELTPNFRPLLAGQPLDPDELEFEEALERTRLAYYRLIWDYAGGNPGVALQAWRVSLGRSPAGEVIVKTFDAPDGAELEPLPDSAVFVLRAIIQLEKARLEDIGRVTMLRPTEIQDALRYGLARGYFLEHDGRYEVSWTWFRPILRFLKRRYLLSN